MLKLPIPSFRGKLGPFQGSVGREAAGRSPHSHPVWSPELLAGAGTTAAPQVAGLYGFPLGDGARTFGLLPLPQRQEGWQGAFRVEKCPFFLPNGPVSNPFKNISLPWILLGLDRFATTCRCS